MNAIEVQCCFGQPSLVNYSSLTIFKRYKVVLKIILTYFKRMGI